MDIIFHGLAAAALRRRSVVWLSVLYGMLPDIIGMNGLFNWGPYHWAHSFWGIALAFFSTRIFRLPWELALFYALHLFLDIFTHVSGTGNLFYPLTDPIRFSGINWWQVPWVEPVGYAGLFMLLAGRYWRRVKSH